MKRLLTVCPGGEDEAIRALVRAGGRPESPRGKRRLLTLQGPGPPPPGGLDHRLQEVWTTASRRSWRLQEVLEAPGGLDHRLQEVQEVLDDPGTGQGVMPAAGIMIITGGPTGSGTRTSFLRPPPEDQEEVGGRT